MVKLNKTEAIIILGGGRNNRGELTRLSIQRLGKGAELYRKGKGKTIFALGGHHSTWHPNRIHFKKTGAQF